MLGSKKPIDLVASYRHITPETRQVCGENATNEWEPKTNCCPRMLSLREGGPCNSREAVLKKGNCVAQPRKTMSCHRCSKCGWFAALLRKHAVRPRHLCLSSPAPLMSYKPQPQQAKKGVLCMELCRFTRHTSSPTAAARPHTPPAPGCPAWSPRTGAGADAAWKGRCQGYGACRQSPCRPPAGCSRQQWKDIDYVMAPRQ